MAILHPLFDYIRENYRPLVISNAPLAVQRVPSTFLQELNKLAALFNQRNISSANYAVAGFHFLFT